MTLDQKIKEIQRLVQDATDYNKMMVLRLEAIMIAVRLVINQINEPIPDLAGVKSILEKILKEGGVS